MEAPQVFEGKFYHKKLLSNNHPIAPQILACLKHEQNKTSAKCDIHCIDK